ncbi:hypothetical protein UPYG_G00190740 [Umbra pygmaea]|uniref:Uncharacterized protein n=1 Tax=Umbra pygmaea TaxID=75934 RepID=A0ABD0WX96_UMBPY
MEFFDRQMVTELRKLPAVIVPWTSEDDPSFGPLLSASKGFQCAWRLQLHAQAQMKGQHPFNSQMSGWNRGAGWLGLPPVTPGKSGAIKPYRGIRLTEKEG